MGKVLVYACLSVLFFTLTILDFFHSHFILALLDYSLVVVFVNYGFYALADYFIEKDE